MNGNIVIWIIALTSIACVMLRPRGLSEAWWACGGALLLVVTGLLPVQASLAAITKGRDVYLFLIGMMTLSELARAEGVFDWIAGLAAYCADRSASRLFALIYAAGTIVTIFLSNDATAVVLTPAVLAILQRMKINPRPHLLACAFIANAASFVLPISNPANLVIFGARMPQLADWIRAFSLPSAVAILVTFLGLRWVCRRDLQNQIESDLGPTPLPPGGRLALAGLGFSALVLTVASALDWPLGLPTFFAAFGALGLASIRNGQIGLRVMKGVSWSVLPLVAGLFVMVEALQRAGMMRLATQGIYAVAHWPAWAADLASGFSVALASNGMNNLPVGLIAGEAVKASHTYRHLIDATLIGVDLGPNLSVTGSLATILWLIALRRAEVKVTPWQFFKVGCLVMPPALLGTLLVLNR